MILLLLPYFYFCYFIILLLLFFFISIIVLLLLFHFILLLLFLFVLFRFIIIIIVVVVFFFITIIIIVLLLVRYFGAIVIYSSCFCIFYGCSGLCWTMIQSCDYDKISISHVMDYMYSAWGSLEFASKCQKPVVVMLLVWRLVAWGVLPGGLGCAAR